MTTTLQELKPSQIKPHKANPRRDVGDVTELAASIAEQGILEPLIVAPTGDGPITSQLYTLIAGHRRLAAAKVAKSKTVLCLIRSDLTDPKAQLEAMLVENLQRTDLTPVEEAEAYQQLLEFPGYTQTRIAKTTGRAIATVRARLKLATLPKPALTKVHAGQISLGEAEALVEFADDKNAYARLERAAGDTATFGRHLQELRNTAKANRAKERAEKKLADAGVRVIPPPSMYDWNARQALKDLWNKGDVEAHRDCPGFAAYVRTTAWNGTAQVTYVCDQPQLHGDQPAVDAAANREAEVREDELRRDDATARREWIREHVLGEPSAGLALDLMRQHTHRRAKQLYGKAESDALDEILSVKVGDPKARNIAIDVLTIEQLAVLVDFIDYASDEVRLQGPAAWGVDGYSVPKAWRTRLTTLYGYTWSEHEQQLIDQAAAEAADKASHDVDDEDDDQDIDQ